MVSMNLRLVVIGLPQVASALGADAEEAIWFTQGYVLVTTAGLLVVGRLGDMFGKVRLYEIGFTIFAVTSALTSLSQNPLEVIVFRGIQGLGGAIILTNGLALITDLTPASELGFAVGINQSANRLGSMVGLTFSGLILYFFDWRALFYLNVPIGVFGALWVRRLLKGYEKPRMKTSMDWIGLATFMTAISSYLLSITLYAYGPSELWTSVGLAVLGSACLVAFVVQERRAADPLLDLKLFRIREVAGGVSANTINSLAFGAFQILLSLYLQLVLNESPLYAGAVLVIYDVVFVVVSTFSGKLSDRYGHVPFTTGGLILTSVALFLFSLDDKSSPFAVVVVGLVILGVGVGIFGSPNASSIMKSVPADRRGVTSGLRNTGYSVSLALSTSLAILIMSLYAPYSTVSAVLSSISPTGISEAMRALFANGIRASFFWFGVVELFAIPPSLLSGKRRPKAVGEPVGQKTQTASL
jgi:EmrB/QacA subfamily drug resistance transporter